MRSVSCCRLAFLFSGRLQNGLGGFAGGEAGYKGDTIYAAGGEAGYKGDTIYAANSDNIKRVQFNYATCYTFERDA